MGPLTLNLKWYLKLSYQEKIIHIKNGRKICNLFKYNKKKFESLNKILWSPSMQNQYMVLFKYSPRPILDGAFERY